MKDFISIFINMVMLVNVFLIGRYQPLELLQYNSIKGATQMIQAHFSFVVPPLRGWIEQALMHYEGLKGLKPL